MTHVELEALVGGYYGNPFRILGPHMSNSGGPAEGAWEVRAFLPQAAEVVLLTSGGEEPMRQEHPAGFYIATLDRHPGAYRFRLKHADGSVSEADDPYRFPPLVTAFDLHLHGEGTNFRAYNMLGAHVVNVEGVAGTRFAVWAPNSEVVSVAGDFNDWDVRRHPMRLREGGVWEIFLPGIGENACYKYAVRSRGGFVQEKFDPYAFHSEVPPRSASVVSDLARYQWSDRAWVNDRSQKNPLSEPMSIYEVHLESWLRGPQNKWLTYRELAVTLVEYVTRMGYTHIELMPVMEHPFSGSWGYQVIGYYAPTSRFGTPDDFRLLVDRCHQAGIGVILDWVPSHFPKDAHGLARFDGTALFEHDDPRQGEHPDWGTLIFNFGRNEVRSFLLSNAMFWLEEYHVDGLRVDAVASMLYLDYGRRSGEWIPNIYGGKENIEAIDFLRRFNELAHRVPGVVTVAEESTSFGGVSRPVYLNGLGFTMKWNMGWMHDMLEYFSKDPIYRKYHQQNITFSMLYAFSENFVLPISHDEVVHLKHSLLDKMPGDEWQRFANVRAFLAYMWGHPGKKLLFMGSEIGNPWEWSHEVSVPWDLLAFDYHRKLQTLCRELNRFYRSQPSLYQVDFDYAGFEWVDFHDVEGSTISFLRFAADRDDFLLFCCNFTPAPRHGYRIGVPVSGRYREVFNTDAVEYGGSGMGNGGDVVSEPMPFQGRPHSVRLTLPPLAVIVFQRERGAQETPAG